MKNATYNWPDLLMKYFTGKITAAEMQELEKQKALSAAKQQEFEELLDPIRFERGLRTAGQVDVKTAWEQFDATHPGLKNNYRSFWQRHFIWLSIIIGVAIVLGIASLHLVIRFFMQ